MDIKFDGIIPDRNKELDKPECLSIQEQLAALEDKPEVPKEVLPMETITYRMESKGNENIFEKPKKKIKTSTKVIVGIIFANLSLLGLIVFLVISNTNKANYKPVDKDTASEISKNNNDDNDNEELSEGGLIGKLKEPKDIKTIDSAISTFSANNEVVVDYLRDIKNEVIDYINRERNDIYIEDIMKGYEEKILGDLDTLGQYKKYYEKFDADALYIVTVNRYQNAYELAQSCKNHMTEKALKNKANSHIEKEEELNIRNINAFAEFLDANDIDFTFDDKEIIIE